jgi:hypothetical protein
VDEYGRQIREGKQIVADYIQKGRPDFAKRIKAMKWIDSSADKGLGFYRLVILVGKERHSIKFYQTELEDATGTPEGDRPLKNRIDAFVRLL